MAEEFFDCPAFSASYNIHGLVTVTYAIIHSSSSIPAGVSNSISTGGQTFSGYVTSISTDRVSGTSWFETTVTLMATTN